MPKLEELLDSINMTHTLIKLNRTDSLDKNDKSFKPPVNKSLNIVQLRSASLSKLRGKGESYFGFIFNSILKAKILSSDSTLP